MDPVALQATLARLGEALPGAAPGVEEALAVGGAALDSGRTLMADGERLREAADQAAAGAQLGVAYSPTSPAARPTPPPDAHQLASERVDAYASLDDELQRVDGEVSAVEASFDSFRGKLADGAAAGKEAAAAFEERLQALGATVEELQTLLGASLDVTLAGFADLQTSLGAVKATVLAETDAFAEQLVAREDDAVAATSAHLDRTWESTAVLVEQLQVTWPDRIVADVAKAMEEVQGGLEGYVQELVKRALDDVLGSVERFEKKVEEAGDASAMARKVLEPLFDQFGNVAEPLVRCLGSIREAGSVVGVDF
jgi:phage shock protein A